MSAGTHFDCIIVGGGPAGLAAACALALRGLRVAVAADRRPPVPIQHDNDAFLDPRTAALFPPAVVMLRRLGAWEAIAPLSAPLSAIRLVDDSGRLLRAPEIVFRATELGLPDLGCNVPNAGLVKALAASASGLGVEMIADGRVVGSDEGQEARAVLCADGRRYSAQLVVAADGRESMLRDLAGIGVDRWTYDQAALATRFAHSRSHSGISTELHGANGPCTTVPLVGLNSSLVWMDKQDAVDELVATSPAAFLERLSARLGGLLGSLSDLGSRRSFPLSGLAAKTMGRNRIALVGEAAHAIPPIGAQGLNLGLTDAAVLADLVEGTAREGGDIGSEALLRAYDKARAADVHRRVNAVDLLNRSVRPSFWPLGLARGAGLHVLAAMPSLRRRLMRDGLFPPDPSPALMKPIAQDGPGNARHTART